MTRSLIDVSHWQGRMLWNIAAPQILGAYLQASQWRIDSEFRRNVEGARAVGLPVGAYHFYRPELSPFVQAELFAPLAAGLDMPPALDLEIGPISARDVDQFIAHCKRINGIQVSVVYTAAWFWDKYISRLSTNVDLWIANWTSAAVPTLPRGFTTWRLWQWSADGNGLGRQYGATGSYAIDLDRYNGTEEEFYQWVQKPSAPVVIPNRVRVAVGCLRVRAAPWGRVVGAVRMGEHYNILDTQTASDGSLWYMIGEGQFIASWFCERV